ncbi:signal peptidase II [Mesorhizobium sp. AaZ16]|uniref:signal peptidase II n=1 Tax=Mesorhizobium sp. AaZ16 TaxID=3402289 RepID=UPI00374F68B1
MNYRSLAAYASLVFAAVAFDQWIKRLVEAGLVLHEQVDILPFLALYRTYNIGVGFSLFEWVGGKGLMALSMAVIAFVLFRAKRTEPDQVMARIGFCLIIGGAIGNLIDRALYGHVIDYIAPHTTALRLGVYNLADALILVGAFIIVLDEFLNWRNEKPVEPSED